MNRLMLIILLFLSGTVFAANQAGKAKLIKPINLGSDTEAHATFENITSKARENGLGDVTIIGAVKSTNNNGRYRVVINWHSIEKNESGKASTKSLQKTLVSSFSTDNAKVEPGVTLTIKGDFERLTSDFQSLKNRIAKDTEVSLNGGSNKGGSKAREFPSGGGTGSNSTSNGGGVKSPDTANSGVNQTSFESCTPRVDESAELVYAQQQRIVRDHTGAETERSKCYDAGAPVQLVRDYSCNAIIDIENRTGFESFKWTYSLGSKEVQHRGCRIDNSRAIAIKTKTDSCDIKHDFINKKSIQLEYLYYTNQQGKEITVTECVDSAVTFAHFSTDQTCTPVVDNVNGLAFIQTRVAIKNAKNTVEYVSDCEPIDTNGTPIVEQACQDKYEHVFAVKQSYLRTYKYYLGTHNEEIIVKECQRSTSTAFPHKYEDTNCGIINDDPALLTIFKQSTHIDTTADGRIEIAPCAESGKTTSYAYIRPINNSPTFKRNGIPYGRWETRLASVFVGNSVDWSDPINTIKLASAGNGYWRGNPKTAKGTDSITARGTYGAGQTTSVTAVKETGREYLRGDGTKYQVLDSRVWTLEAR